MKLMPSFLFLVCGIRMDVQVEARGGCPVSTSNAPCLIPLKPVSRLSWGSLIAVVVLMCIGVLPTCTLVPHIYTCPVRTDTSLEVELWTAVGSGSSGRAANTLNHWAISPDSSHQAFIKLKARELRWASDLHYYPPPVTGTGLGLDIFFSHGC